jgi:prolyl 4-hydroxylase
MAASPQPSRLDGMNARVHFSSELKDWIVHNLQRGCVPDVLVHSMQAQGFDAPVAQAMVAAFAAALARGEAPPSESIVVEQPDAAYVSARRGAATPPCAFCDSFYVPDPPRLAPGNRIAAGDRDVDVLMRLQRPCVAVLGNVLSEEECEAVIGLGAPRLAPSTVVDPHSGMNHVAAHRSSEGMFFGLGENALIARLDQRLSLLMGAPIEHGEGLQLLRYRPGCQSSPHYDFLVPQNEANRASIARSGQRMSTLVVYLNDVPAGGATEFPELGLTVAPRRGNAVYFEYANGAGQLDHATLHAGASVEQGEKWVLTKWMRTRPFVAGA